MGLFLPTIRIKGATPPKGLSVSGIILVFIFVATGELIVSVLKSFLPATFERILFHALTFTSRFDSYWQVIPKRFASWTS